MKNTLIIAALTILTFQVQADEEKKACTAADLNGDYVMFQAAVNRPELNHTGRCDINVTDGELSGSCEFGRNVSGNPNFHGPVYGDATINTNCSVEMTISFDPDSDGDGQPGPLHIDSTFDLQLAQDKNTFVGSFINTFGVEGITNGTKVGAMLPATAAGK